MQKRNFFLALSVLCSVLTVGFMTDTTIAQEKKGSGKIVAIGSGPVGGGYNMIVMGVNKYWEKELGITGQVVPGVAKDNLVRFNAGRLDVLITPSSWYNVAHKGDEKMGFKEPVKDLRIMFHIYSNPFYVITLKNSGIKNISDLKGKRVGCGAAQDAWEKMIGDKFEANGLKFFGDSPDFSKRYASFSDMCRMLGDGVMDACVAMYEGLTPQPATQQLMNERELRAVEWDPAIFPKFVGTYFPPAVIKKELLPFLERDHKCFEGGVAALAARANVDETLVYNLTKVSHKNMKQLAQENPFWQYPIKYPEILIADYGVPYHPGAIKYWKEVGLWKGK